jgi:iron-sulfur cluster repair protein YtfE (RIC family)
LDREAGWVKGDDLLQEEAMDALSLIKKDHEEFKKLMEQLDKTTERGVKTREQVFEKLKTRLAVHETIEEEIFYPALKEHPKAKEIVLEGYEEHHAVDMLIEELTEVPLDDESWDAKFTVIKENVEHHIEEEEGVMFKKARQIFDKSELEDLGTGMEERRGSVTL